MELNYRDFKAVRYELFSVRMRLLIYIYIKLVFPLYLPLDRLCKLLKFYSVLIKVLRDEVTGEWRKLHNEELRDLYSSPSIIRIIKSRRMRWVSRQDCAQSLPGI
jgi:hypothetical protein